MAIIRFSPDDIDEKELKDNIDLVIHDSVEQSTFLEELIEDAPDILQGHSKLRDILRSIKRGNSIEESLACCAFGACPPKNTDDDVVCGITTCSECWKKYIFEYKNIVLEDIDGRK